MRIFAALLGLALAACASVPEQTRDEALSATLSDVQAAQIETLLASRGQSDAATRATIEGAMGAADVARQDGAGAALTYRLEACALLLLFAGDANNAMRLRDVHVSARRVGVAAPSLAQCAAEAAARLP